MTLPLEKIRVLDCSNVKAGPMCGQILADFGAEVIRIEYPGGSFDRYLPPYAKNGRSFYLSYTCRNKKGITLNLKEMKGREIFRKLVRKSDIIIENVGPERNKQLALDYETLKEVKEDIIVISVSAYGQNGPYAMRSGFDGIAQGMCGVMWTTGFSECNRPVRLGISWVDTATGIYAALGAMVALYHRDNTGKGQHIDVSLLDVAVSFMESIFGEYKISGKARPQIGNANVLAAPYDSYKAKDGWVFLAAPTDSTWVRLCKATGRQELLNKCGFKTIRDRNRSELRDFFYKWLSEWIADKTVKEVLTHFAKFGVPCGPIHKIPDVLTDKQIKAREMMCNINTEGIGELPILAVPLKFSETLWEIRSGAPNIGEHNKEVYNTLLGLDIEELKDLEDAKII